MGNVKKLWKIIFEYGCQTPPDSHSAVRKWLFCLHITLAFALDAEITPDEKT